MDVFIAILVLIAAGLLGTTKRAYRIRRSRPIALLVAGGWVSLLVGALLGPAVFGVIDREAVFQAVPLLGLGLGWIGLMVGLQLRLDLLRMLPRVVYAAAAVDTVVTILVFGAIVTFTLIFWTQRPEIGPLLLPAAFMITASLGWSLESRSLGAGADDTLALHLRASGALTGVVAILLFGLAAKLVLPDEIAGRRLAPGYMALKLAHSVLLAVAVGLIGRYMLRLAGRSKGSQFTVFLGIVAFLAGSAKQLDASPLITAMCAGAVIANTKSSAFREFEAFIFRAEHTFGILFGLLAGLMLEPVFAPALLGGAAALVAARVAIKPFVFRRVTLAMQGKDPRAPHFPAHSILYAAAGRQSPLMLALGVSLVLIEPSLLNKELLAIMVCVGVLAEVTPAVLARRSWGTGAAPAPRTDQPEGGEP